MLPIDVVPHRYDRVVPEARTVAGSPRELLAAHRQDIRDAVARHRGQRVRVFGSVARGDASAGSDIDLLVDFETGSSLFDLLHLQHDLEELLGRPVDVISTGGLTPRDDHILREAQDL